MGIVQTRVERIDIDRQAPLAPEVIPGVLIGVEDPRRIQPQALRHTLEEAGSLRRIGAVVGPLVGIQRRIGPDRLAIGAPEKVQRPARQLLARIPLALSEMQQAQRRVALAQATHQFARQQPLGRPHRIGVPLGALAIVDRHEGRLAALGQAHIAGLQIGIDAMAQRLDGRPLRVGVGQGDARRLPDPLDLHLVRELALGRLDHAADRRGRRRLGRTRQRDVAFAGQQAGGGVQPDPAPTGQIDLAPRVQIGEIGRRADRSIERLHIGRELDQVAGNEASREPQMAQQLHQQPGRVATGTGGTGQCLLGRLHARLQADQIADVVLQPLVERHQEVERGLRFARHGGQVAGELRRQRAGLAIRRQFERLLGRIGEGKLLGLRLEEEVERVEHRHLGDQIDFDAQFLRRLGKHQPGQVVRLRILLPVHEMPGRRHPHRIGQDARAGVRAGTQPNDLRAQGDRTIVAVVRDVVQGDMDRHGGVSWRFIGSGTGRSRYSGRAGAGR